MDDEGRALGRPSAIGADVDWQNPDVLAAEIVEDLQAALAQFAAIAEELGEG